jgi:hypothetical protein
MINWFRLKRELNKVKDISSYFIKEEPVSIFKDKIKVSKQNGSEINKNIKLIIENKEFYTPFVIVDKEDDFILSGGKDLISCYKMGINKINVVYINKSILFEDKINEIFNDDKNIDLIKINDNQFKSNFEVDNEIYEVNFSKIKEWNNTYEIMFRILMNTNNIITTDDIFNQIRRTYQFTNLNKEIKVFSYVVSAIKKFINTINPTILAFKTDNVNRYRLYIKIIKKFINQFPNYNLKERDIDVNGQKEYMGILYRKELDDKMKN